MAYALGYDTADLDSDDEGSSRKTHGYRGSNSRPPNRFETTPTQAGRQCAHRVGSASAGAAPAFPPRRNHSDGTTGGRGMSRIGLNMNANARPSSTPLLANGIRNPNEGSNTRPNTFQGASRTQNETDVSIPRNLRDMDKLDTATLERLEWMEPLGFRALSELTGLSPEALRKHFWASKLKPSSSLFTDLYHYFKNSHSPVHSATRLRIKRIIELKRFNENNSDYKVPNVRLLWHGTQTANVRGILTNGFRLPTHQGMFGRGVYFADRVTKSAQYCKVSPTRGSKGTLFLCAVNLGRMHRATTGMNNLTGPPPGYNNVKGCGSHVPNRNDIRKHRGAMIPCGKTFLKPGNVTLEHNEYIVYDLDKIAILFLVEFEYK